MRLELPHWREMAIKAEAEVERLTNLLDHYNAKCAICDCVNDVMELHAELTKLRKVVEAAREFISSTGCDYKECGKCDPKYVGFCRWSGIGQALAELDKEGTIER